MTALTDTALHTLIANIYGTRMEYRAAGWRKEIQAARSILQDREAARWTPFLTGRA